MYCPDMGNRMTARLLWLFRLVAGVAMSAPVAFESNLTDALERTEQRIAERPDLVPLISIQKQLEYLINFNNGAVDGSRLKDINVGLVAVREIENWDDNLAGLLYKIDVEVDRLRIAEALKRA